MIDNSLTIALEGDVLLPQLVEMVQRFQNLADLLSHEIAPDVEIQWLVEDLQAGSALATVVGLASEPEPVLEVVRGYNKVGYALQANEPIPFSDAVRREARALTKIVGEKVTAIRFETALSDYVVYSAANPQKKTPTPRVSFGAVKGQVQALTSRGQLRFILYDSVFDKPVSCYAQEDQSDILRDIWGKKVVVSGRVTREPELGRAISIRDITAIDEVREPVAGSYKLARGIFQWSEGDEPAEVSIRRLRDAEG